MTLCRKKPPSGLGMCELTKGHGGQYHKDGDQRWPTNAAEKSQGLKRGEGPKRTKNIKPTSQKQSMLNARWAGMKAMALYLLGPDAVCGLCENPLHADQQIDADHIVPRSQGGSYDPDNLQLVHRSCHSEKHGTPQFGEAS